jgi:23S rRNA (uracil1939-C5)-methyltransferase
MNRNDLLTLTAIDYTENALGVAKIDGFVVFVNGLMMGESAIVRIEKVTCSSRFWVGHRTHNASSPGSRHIRAARSPISAGVARLQHMNATHQLAFKKAHVQSLFKRQLDSGHRSRDSWDG